MQRIRKYSSLPSACQHCMVCVPCFRDTKLCKKGEYGCKLGKTIKPVTEVHCNKKLQVK